MACNDKNPLTREGVDRLTRKLEALPPTFAKVDERSMEDLILFAKKYAAYIKYKDLDNTDAGTWESLMKVDISVVLAVLLSLDMLEVSDYIKLLYKKTKLGIATSDDAEASLQFKFLFDILFSLAKTVDEQCGFLKEEIDHQQTIKSVIQTKLNTPFSKLYNFRAYNLALLSISNQTDNTAPLNTIDSHQGLTLTYFSLTTEKLKITIPGTEIREKISHVINHNLFNNQISLLLSGISSILQKAQELFTKSLNEYSNHEPHYGLFLAFLKLFNAAQTSLNDFSVRHLDFYYKDVLRLKNQNPVPNKVHLTVGLQKHIDQHLLTKGTLFKGGKDPNGKEMNYRLTQDVVFNQAEVKEIKAFQIHNKSLLAFPVINSPAGIGGKFEGDDKSWFAFGDKKMIPTQEAGFVVASNLLFLKEGERTVKITVNFENPLRSKTAISRLGILRNQKSIPFDIILTGEKDWVSKSVDASFSNNQNEITFVFSLGVEEPPILPYLEKTHKKNFNTTLPLLVAYLDQGARNIWYADLMNNPISSIHVEVKVIGIKDLSLSSDGGSIDASKPFKPFGDFPKQHASFYIGSREIFQKNLESIKVNLPVSVPIYCEYLHGNDWETYPFPKDGNGYLVQKNIAGNLLKQASLDFRSNEFLQAKSFEGFLRIRLDTNTYSLATHMSEVNKALDNIVINSQQGSFQPIEVTKVESNPAVAKAIEIENLLFDQNLTANLKKVSEISGLLKVTGNSVPVPKEVIAESFSIDYTASENIPINATSNPKHAFFNLSPFGYFKPIPGEKSLVPRFSQEGELLIGIAKANVPITINMLFLLADGSSNPLKAQEPVRWSFLKEENNWVEFEANKVIDGTINLTRTGIVTFGIPKEAGSNHTAVTSGLIWVKASVAANTDAVCKIIDIKAQGALTELVQSEQEGIEFRNLLPPGSISKLKHSDSAIKSITQPADSTGGRVRESDPDYYQRVSERLRHKQRAISIWDYEHLILQEFPSVYQTKCLNHTGFYEKNGENIFCENFPGHVTVICIPDLKNKTNINPLRPYTSVGTLTDISLFLEKLKNPFAQLHVVNPQFEEVQLEFEVRFHDNMDEVFYRNLLDIEIEQFLCPWAWDSNQKLTFGGKINKSTLINFVEERPYVDFLSCFKIHHIIRDEEGKIAKKNNDLEEITASSSRSVLVSHFEESNLATPRHIIQVIQTCDC
ncbi:baseplate J/gp47 family protein [Aquiflexum sp. TKW24L]|uniref:baseplate J/gp47 family protein n=1 Tax=Aquiflexum sp. TKW24L TaxID=2942212 RepID=UPI0020BE322A|nr:baseplate J/gp47 family protein [Aquiflexum sp. TKW24L]MCL6258870.1 baseplate J/gp47 family protein [Aquiflexum sp. TKW24L]